MKEYLFTEKRREGYYRSLDGSHEEEYETYEVEIQIDCLTKEDVDRLRKFIREIASAEIVGGKDG